VKRPLSTGGRCLGLLVRLTYCSGIRCSCPLNTSAVVSEIVPSFHELRSSTGLFFIPEHHRGRIVQCVGTNGGLANYGTALAAPGRLSSAVECGGPKPVLSTAPVDKAVSKLLRRLRC